jgi:ribonuclease P protein component
MVWPGDERLTKSMRLRARADFDDLFARGIVVVDQILVMHGRSSSEGRLGIAISKRVGHAPLRNRWKRLIREAYRKQVQAVPALQRVDIVVRPRRGAIPTYPAIARSLASLANRLDRQLKKTRPEGGTHVQP